MSLVVVGLSHHTSAVELRELLAFPQAATPAALLALRKKLGKAGVVILSTCNRVEVYVNYPLGPEELYEAIVDFLSQWHTIPSEEFAHALYMHEGQDAVGHLFRVASSLDSLVVGEGQILGQVHDAYLIAQTEQTTDKIIDALFQKAFSMAKKVRTTSSLGAGKISVSSVAVDLAASIFAGLQGKSVLIIGSGEMGQRTLKSLVSHELRHILIMNRTLEKALPIAKEYGGEVIPYDQMTDALSRADIVITSTGAGGYILSQSQFSEALKRRNGKPIFVIDISVPRVVDPNVNELDNIYLYDIDDLQRVADENVQARREEVSQCLGMVETGVDRFCQWMSGLAAEPTIISMAKEFEIIRERELEKTLQTLPDLTDVQREEIVYLTRRITNTLLQRPMKQIKREVTKRDPQTVLGLVHSLFGLRGEQSGS